LSSLVFVGTTIPTAVAERAVAVLPITNTVEEEGTFTNLRGRVQRFLQGRTAPGVARPSWFVLTDLLAATGGAADFHLPADVFAAMVSTHQAFAGLDYEALGMRGLPVLASESATAGAAV
jgi:predicted molibdopterin-dependent oxidoreductase YjgC